MAKKSEQRTEATVAILAVMAIFSFAGILNWDSAEGEVSKRAELNLVESTVVGGPYGGQMRDLPEESMSVIETASADVAPAVSGGAVAFGTSLSSAISQFSVEEGTELASGTAQMTVGSK